MDRIRYGAICCSLAGVFVFQQVAAQEVLKDNNEEWDYLLQRFDNGMGPVPEDPSLEDFDFYDTWFLANYSGLTFESGFAPLGYGQVSQPLSTNVWDNNDLDALPPLGSRFGVYFRTTVTPTSLVRNLKFTGILDDGAVIYVNGTEFARVNMPADDELFYDSSSITFGDEDNAVEVTGQLSPAAPANQPMQIAIAVFNYTPPGGNPGFSSDLHMDFRVESVESTGGPPPNDDFEDAIFVSPIGAFSGSTDNALGELVATRQQGEPVHDGQTGGGSVWWSFVSPTTGRLSVTLDKSTFNTLLAVYQGDAVDSLTLVERYSTMTGIPASSSRDTEPFERGAFVEFDAVSGETYHIAVDGKDGEAGDINGLIGFSRSTIQPEARLLVSGSDWEYLLHTDTGNQPADPGAGDPDFYTTWQQAAGYNGPMFTGGTAPFGYGSIDAFQTGGFGAPEGTTLATDVWGGRDHTGEGDPDPIPPINQRYTAYFRTTFTPSQPVTNLGVKGLFDDGAIVFINGQEGDRINMPTGVSANDWQLLATTPDPGGRSSEQQSQEAVIQNLNLPANQSVNIAISVHNSAVEVNGMEVANSSDLGFDVELFSVVLDTNPPMPGDEIFISISPGSSADTLALSWIAETGMTFTLEQSDTLQIGSFAPSGITVTESNGTYSAEVPVVNGVPTRFYRAAFEQ